MDRSFFSPSMEIQDGDITQQIPDIRSSPIVKSKLESSSLRHDQMVFIMIVPTAYDIPSISISSIISKYRWLLDVMVYGVYRNQ